MSLFKFFIIVVLSLFVVSCGFTPVYKEITDDQTIENLASIEINVPKNLMGQSFKYTLTDILNPEGIKVIPKYNLDVKIDRTNTPLAIETNQTITRYKTIVRIDYVMKDVNTSAVVSQGYMKREGEYDKVASDYATYVSEEDVTKRLVKELAEDARMRIISVLANK